MLDIRDLVEKSPAALADTVQLSVNAQYLREPNQGQQSWPFDSQLS